MPTPSQQSQGGESAIGAPGDGASPSALADAASSAETLALGKRAMSNTFLRTGAEIIGRLASLALFVEAGRAVGQNGLGAFVFALAFLGFVMVAVDLGLDRWMLRTIATEHSASDHLFFGVLSLKFVLAVPLLGGALLVLHLVGYNHLAQATTLALVVGVFSDSLARSQLAVFLAHERGGAPAFADAIQRILSAALGIAALKAGYGIVAVAVAYSIGSAIGVLIGFVLLHRTVGVPARTVRPARWRAMAAQSIPFASLDVFTTLLARVDTLLLAVIATQAIVGRYGAAYRLFESSLVLTYALSGAFAAMYTYLGHDTSPTLGFTFQRSLKLALTLLVPVAVVLGVLARQLCRLFYGDAFTASGTPLRILAPAVVLLAVVVLTTSLIVSRENPRRMVWATAAIAFVNIALNLILIPLYSDSGAAIAMLASEALFAAWILRLADRTVGGIDWLRTGTGPLVAGACMAVVMLILDFSVPLAVAVGMLVYVLAMLAIERLVSPGDVEAALRMLRRGSSPRPVR